MTPFLRFLRPTRLVLSLLIAGGVCSGAARAQQVGESAQGETEAEAAKATYPPQALTPQILYQLMLAEVAGARGQRVLAAESYLSLARQTQDGRLARRAAELAVAARQADLTAEAAKLWLELEPTSQAAQHLTAGAVASGAKIEELEQRLATALARQGEAIGPALLSLNRGLARIPDTKLIRRLVFQLTEPYLDRPEAYFARSHAAYLAGDPAGATEALEGALRLRPDWEQAVMLKAQLQQEAKTGQGLKTLRDYLVTHPDAREPRITLARLLVADKQMAPALEQFEILLKRQPDDRDLVHAAALLAMQMGDRPLASKHFRHLLDLNFSEPDLIRLYLGQLAEESKQFDEAVYWYKAVAPGERFLSAQARLTQMLAGQGRLTEARQHLHEVAKEANAEDRTQYMLLEAQLLRDAGQHEVAYEVLDEALQREPDNTEFLYESALTAERLGRLEVMEGRLRKLIALKPEHAHAYNALGYSLVDRNLRLEEGEALIRKGLALKPNDPFIVDSLGWVLYRRGKLPEALETLRKAFELRPDPEIAAHLGEVLWVSGQRDEAAKIWRDAAKAHPDNSTLADVIKKFKP